MMGGGNMQQLARQAQKLQQQMTKMQEELEAREYEASSGGGIGVSRAYFDENNRMRILDGFLKDYEESIVGVKRKYKTAEISIEFQDSAIRMKLDYELMRPMEMISQFAW